MKEQSPYFGRFAPSPTGPLHFGSLVAALGSWLDARSHGGHWAVRLDDLDHPRCPPGAGDTILRTLEGFGLVWDGPVVRQSEHLEDYAAALERLVAAGAVFPCACSRRDIRAAGHSGAAGFLYPGTCRHGLPPGAQPRSWRFRVDRQVINFGDRLRGPQRVDLATAIGDFVVRRADGLFAYHLAMVLDDAALGITDVVRGGGLLDCTGPQIALQRALKLPTPRYLHLPTAVNEHGSKLSKQTHAPAVSTEHAARTLTAVLRFLGQSPPVTLAEGPVTAVLEWAIQHWRPAALHPGPAPPPT